MPIGPVQTLQFDLLDSKLRCAHVLTVALFRQVVEGAGDRLSIIRRAGKTTHIERLLEAGACTDAALALIEIEMPNWRIRQLVYENAEWNGAAQPKGFWRRLAQTLDAYFAERSKRAVPAITLRRSQHELARCRRLMHRSRRARRNYSQRPSGGRDAHLTIKWQAAYSTGCLCVAFALSQIAIGWLSINLNGRGRPAGPSIFRLGLIVGVLSDSIRLFFIARNGSDLGQRAGPRGVRAALSIQGIGLAFCREKQPAA